MQPIMQLDSKLSRVTSCKMTLILFTTLRGNEEMWMFRTELHNMFGKLSMFRLIVVFTTNHKYAASEGFRSFEREESETKKTSTNLFGINHECKRRHEQKWIIQRLLRRFSGCQTTASVSTKQSLTFTQVRLWLLLWIERISDLLCSHMWLILLFFFLASFTSSLN